LSQRQSSCVRSGGRLPWGNRTGRTITLRWSGFSIESSFARRKSSRNREEKGSEKVARTVVRSSRMHSYSSRRESPHEMGNRTDHPDATARRQRLPRRQQDRKRHPPLRRAHQRQPALPQPPQTVDESQPHEVAGIG